MVLAPTPPANDLVTPDRLNEKQDSFPLEVYQCSDCGHAQLLDIVDPERLFRHYLYVSGTSPVFVRHLRDYARWSIEKYKVSAGSLIVEIASNDGTLLKYFQEKGMSILGIDPAENLAKAATKAGIETLPEFFSVELAKKIKHERGAAKVVAANNVFAHADDLAGFADGVRELLADDGVFILEVSYLVDVFEKTLFDTIYHEHVSYHTVGPLRGFFPRHGLELIDVLRVDSQGGSIRCVAQLAGGPWPQCDSVEELIDLEKRLGLNDTSAMKSYARQVDGLKKDLRELLGELESQGKTVAGFGAPAKATTLMHYFGLGADDLDFIVDENPLKQGLFTPGTLVPIVAPDALSLKKPDYTLVLAWNFADNIVERYKGYSDAGGKFIVPIPKVVVR